MITIIIPTYNEEKTIKKIISGVKQHGAEILVVGAKKSTDNTIQIAKSLGARTLIDNGRGKGAAMRLAIDAAKGDILVFIDADGSHISADIPAIVAPIKSGSADMVIASRMLGGSEELHGTISQFIRMCFSAIITLIINYRFGVRITDSQNGFRAIKKDVAKKLGLKANIFDIETEMTMKCAKNKYRILEVPSKELSRVYGKSGINVLKMGPIYLWRVIINLF
ncbi:MAG: glycosyltransferase family 2 protein [Nanoarchaeota archaeon]|nr:glycosyltransferase family 2 protein [Nanoarchaeota archaeon]MBU4300093.1 glycosyltransferase family 2 protein [Nanoarchaeota archaeon]MBU4452295.1 glycosyltransferase family 2 protein [Nanoarchaeota archaeon]MCG2723820.1 glycosyltransferase family 2 protein [archaeon]